MVYWWFHFEIKSQSITYLLIESEHIYWIWDLEGEVHSLSNLWISGLQECYGNGFFEIGWAGSSFWSNTEKSRFFC